LNSKQTSFDRYEVHCGSLFGKVVEFEKKLVEMEIKHHAIVAEQETLKNKNNGMRDKS
jgi:hypothetical protein